ncbi:RNA-binding transcriptional accessory protein [Lusitaniella coriacea LEGE 07157]|uniref:RNA-binding transcriptional accessory protein n=1 Tax=Lusitaniella coriacea LEGE 07157 TaxID=945747 RepID=A0A8J7DVA5_9CYAN|nr:Tex family protein [Lusitaniella coriacea]MBE9115670.1 RNA-binding transcriptional accessory protein [Lusitaniella coriacea LEGE 07157]
MLNLISILADELSLNPKNIAQALELRQEGGTIPFISRYRKERTGGMDELQLRDLFERYEYLETLEKRKQTILDAIASQGKLTEALEAKITACTQKNELEDLYLPYKPKRRTRATAAREKGLEPLAEWIQSLNKKNSPVVSLEAEAAKYLDAEKGVESVEEALKGASDIIAEEVAEKPELRAYVREFLLNRGLFVSKIKEDYPEGSTKFEMYRNYNVSVKRIAPHNLLALFRGEAEGILTLNLDCDEDEILSYLESQELRAKQREVRTFYQHAIADAFKRLMKNSLTSEARSLKKREADIESIQTFETNLRELLLSPPAGMKPTLAIDPGFRTGCKVSVLDETGKFLKYQAIFPHTGERKRTEAAQLIKNLINKYAIELIAIGNGTASRETDAFIAEVLTQLERKPIKVIVNESGASIYSASDVARSEFPNLDVTVRGAISIGRRLQDPLAELVKIDPKSIGVGQYQHDVDQKLLQQKLEETVESCVNYVGIDLNTASKELLTFVSGLTPTVAQNIVAYRNDKGAFTQRKQLLKVAKLGPKAFEQAAGFLRIRNGKNPLDNTAVHPESYSVVETIATDLNLPLTQISKAQEKLKTLNLKNYVTDTVGLPTLKDMIGELEKPGRDPRAQFQYATFKEGINEISDLIVGMELEGIVTNVVNFGAFVDIGVHQDGLVHISQLANRFVDDPKTVVKVGQVVKVKVMEINETLKRIGLSMKAVE